MAPRVNREHPELIARLREHCAILEDFHQKACREGQVQYLGEIAGKLRVLTHRSRSNRPLLIELMAVAGIEVPITIDKPRGRYTTDLPSYLSSLACAIRLPSGELAELSNSDLIALWSQQSGAAHEDWALDERLATVFASGLFVGGQPIHGRTLCGICRTVLFVGREFLGRVSASSDGA